MSDIHEITEDEVLDCIRNSRIPVASESSNGLYKSLSYVPMSNTFEIEAVHLGVENTYVYDDVEDAVSRYNRIWNR